MMEDLRQFAANNNLDREAWILLYCYYKRSNYVHGMEYTRWKYENLYNIPEKLTPPIPRSLYKCFMLVELVEDPSALPMRAAKFYTAFKTFAQLGAYGFAHVVFDEIAEQFPAIVVYLVNTTLQMLQGKIENSFQLQTLPSDNSERGMLLVGEIIPPSVRDCYAYLRDCYSTYSATINFISMATLSIRVGVTIRQSLTSRICSV